jgi:BirA family biotin operon repressor/biotin-[acetyl-CoA-carboxylase] ligase
MNKLIKKHIIKDFSISEFDVMESTMDITRTMPDKHGSFTKNQTNGRGTNGRKWEAKIGNLFLSICVKPENKTVNEATQLSFVTAITLINTLKELSKNKLNIKCKWPNDVLIDGKKIAGILLESEIDRTKNEMKYVVIGVGVNVIYSPDNVIYPTTNLAKEGIKIDATDLMKKFVSQFSESYKTWKNTGFKNIRESWLKHAYKLNEHISVKINEEKVEGVVEDLDWKGSLIIREPNGSIKTIISGDTF